VPQPLSTRRATADDLDTLLANVQAGFDSYVEFAPAGWQPPVAAARRERDGAFLADAGTWALLCLAEDRPVGHVSFLQAREPATVDDGRSPLERPAIPGLAHFWQLFVIPEYWGTGAAAILHDAAITEMCGRGFDRTRLYTPTAHARARRFYERRGWMAAGDEWHDELGLVLSEYRLTL
jgi:GNAT superfamily N-acetyltransferase